MWYATIEVIPGKMQIDVLKRLVNAYTFNQGPCCPGRRYTKFILQELRKSFVLTHGRGPLPRCKIEFDHLLLNLLLQRLNPERRQTRRKRVLDIPDGGVMPHQPPMTAQQKQAQSLTLDQHPIVVPAEQEITAIVAKRGTQSMRQRRLQFTRWSRERERNSGLECDNVKPDLR
ncbi:hypothetical protein [Bradyrhizobium sp. JYMT SZCCT0180]|uniref:hypothetical protein n=1 Tax=Bradyrhizobium sp. JYMT SZCCT0180 TaxID=2807666 RepID=UPI0020117830|nr:hypothetical protein [Bradyrhizobium sp. JYMT SZCCT0180]